jgi:hypothetical protein
MKIAIFSNHLFASLFVSDNASADDFQQCTDYQHSAWHLAQKPHSDDFQQCTDYQPSGFLDGDGAGEHCRNDDL